MTRDILLNHISTYNKEEVDKIKKAYDFACEKHKGQYRQSGEEYITHPLNVAYILSEMYADKDTIIAALLHDTLEDTNTTKEEIEDLFGESVAELVDGVTKISKIEYISGSEAYDADTRKILSSISKDARIVIIKLADRLHNMRTISPKTHEKQVKIALETMKIFVPLSFYLGAYRIKNELEDICFSILMPDKYNEYSELLANFKIDSEQCVKDMLSTIDRVLNDENIPHAMKMRTKNVYGIYKQLRKDNNIYNAHDLLALKIMVDEIKNCYITLGLIHSIYPSINDKFKDYISSPKANMYQSLHTTVFGPEERLVQTQIRTFDMDKVASFGLLSYWGINKGDAREKMQEDLSKKFQFYGPVTEIDNSCSSNQEFIENINNEILTDRIYVYDSKGERYELPKGSTIIDLAYKISDEKGNTAVYAIIRGHKVYLDYELSNNDIVKIVTNPNLTHQRTELAESAKTVHARRRILRRNN